MVRSKRTFLSGKRKPPSQSTQPCPPLLKRLLEIGLTNLQNGPVISCSPEPKRPTRHRSLLASIGLSLEFYSAHSLRRTKAIFLYRQGTSVELIGRFLGHRSPASTIRYLGIDTAQAQEAALTNDIFAKPTAAKLRRPDVQLSTSDIEKIAAKVAEKITKNTEGF